LLLLEKGVGRFEPHISRHDHDFCTKRWVVEWWCPQGGMLTDGRRGRNTRHLLIGLLRQSVFGRNAGYERANDAERPARDLQRSGQSLPVEYFGQCMSEPLQ